MQSQRRIHIAIWYVFASTIDKLLTVRCLISGGGIGGLSLAVVLGKFCRDIEIDLYETLPRFTEIGAGISVWKRTWFIMQELGLDQILGKMAVQPPVDELSGLQRYSLSLPCYALTLAYQGLDSVLGRATRSLKASILPG